MCSVRQWLKKGLSLNIQRNTQFPSSFVFLRPRKIWSFHVVVLQSGRQRNVHMGRMGYSPSLFGQDAGYKHTKNAMASP